MMNISRSITFAMMSYFCAILTHVQSLKMQQGFQIISNNLKNNLNNRSKLNQQGQPNKKGTYSTSARQGICSQTVFLPNK